MRLSQLTFNLEIPAQPGESWLVLGPEADVFAARLPVDAQVVFNPSAIDLSQKPAVDGLLLAGALSAGPEPLTWLEPLLAALKLNAALVAIDWQADGRLDVGPDLELRVKRGKLSRMLRESGFDQMQTIADHPLYYALRAVKEPPRPPAFAGEFVAVATMAELPRNTMKEVEVFGHWLVVANTGREIVAFSRTCPHAGQHLHRGKLRGRKVICPRHGYIWNVCTGEPIEPVDEDLLPTYPVRVNEGRIWVALAESV